jgi:hypothetical protein
MEFNVILTRALIEVPTVKSGFINEAPGKTAFLRIIEFTPLTSIRVQEALDYFIENDFTSLIIDLRDNPGGVLSAVEEVSDKFIDGITWAAKEMVRVSSGDETIESWRVGSPENEAKNWFLSNFPLLGSMAAPFKIVMDRHFCQKENIQIAAINVWKGEIYINPTARLSPEENRFVIAHELLHAGLQHAERRQGRDPYLWNIACDYVINGWLNEMQVGEMPQGCLYDVLYKDWSAESIYEELIKNLRKNQILYEVKIF